MHNWRLLLLAFLAVLQPIASFTDRNLVDGREQCCDRNSLLRDTRLTYGTFRLNKLPEDRRLSRSESREDRRYEVRKADVLTRPSTDRRLVEFRSEREVRNQLSYEPARFYRTEFRRDSDTERPERFSRNAEDRERRARDDNRISSRAFSRDLYDRDTARIRFSRHTDIRQQDRDNRAFVTRESRDQSRLTRSLDGEESRITEFRREVQRNRDSAGEFSRIQEARETRDILQRARPDVARNAISNNRENRRVVRERTEERRARTNSRMDNRERRSHDRRTRVMVDNRRDSLRYMSEDRVQSLREESRLNQRDTRVERQNRNHFRREVERRDHLRLQRNDEMISRIRMSERRDLRERSAEERRNTRQSTERLQNAELRSTRLERVDNRRDARLTERRLQARSRDDTRAYESRRTVTRRMLDREPARYRDISQERRERRALERFEVRDSKRDQRMNAAYRIAKADDQRSDSRFRSPTNLSRTREISAAVREKNQSNEKFSIMNWQYIMYTLQGLYICHALMQMLSPTKSKKSKSRVWWCAAPSHIKVD